MSVRSTTDIEAKQGVSDSNQSRSQFQQNNDIVNADEDRHDDATLINEGTTEAFDMTSNRDGKDNHFGDDNTMAPKQDPNLVTWSGPDDPTNPKNWTGTKKWTVTFVVSAFTLISPLSSSIVAPALDAIAKDLHITNDVEKSLVLSIFVLAYAVGPLLMGPLSELYGRSRVLQISNFMYFFFNLGCGLARTKVQMIVFRFLAGLGGSAPLAIGGGVSADLFTAEERGKAIAIYSLAPLLGPAIGPIVGGFVTQNTTWRWIFYSTTIADGFVWLMGILFVSESYAPVILHRVKIKKIKATGNKELYTEFDSPDRTARKMIARAMERPCRLIATQPIIQVLGLYQAYLYGLIYLVLSSFPILWTSPEYYHEKLGISGLNYIALGVGFWLGTQLSAPLQDRAYAALKRRNNGVGRPEFRVALMFPASLLVPFGLFIYGWTAQFKTHWIGPDIGAAVFAAGACIGFQCIQTYIVDSYTRYAASASAATTVLRSLFGFAFPLFAPDLYKALGYGWGNSLLAFIAIVIGWPAPLLLWKFGQTLRKRSPYAAG